MATAAHEQWRIPADGRTERASLLDVDDAVWAAVPAAERESARRILSVGLRRLPAGPWSPAELSTDPRPFALLLLEGALIREVMLGGRASAQLLGPRELLRPWEQAETELPCSMEWTVLEEVTLAVLDQRFLMAARQWPDLVDVIHRRLSDQLDNAARRAALCALPRVGDRILALFWQLADTWGVVRADGVAIHLSLTHDLIGRMIGAKRPTVSLALSILEEQGSLHRSADAWVLSQGSRELLAP